jgi:osmoprotectant transport system substrate-binding protein
VRKEVYDKLGVKDLSDFQQLVKENPDEATICVGTEFSTRDDGLPGMEKAYNFQFPSDNIVKIDEGLIYQATNKGDKCNYGEVFATDGRIKGLGLELISDSKGFFPLYNPALTVNKKVLDEYPQIEKIFAPISKKLTTEELQKLNTQVDIDGQLPEDVAQKWLSDNGFI